MAVRWNMAPKDDSWVRRFTVTDPFKHKKGFTLYKVTSVVSIQQFILYKRINNSCLCYSFYTNCLYSNIKTYMEDVSCKNHL